MTVRYHCDGPDCETAMSKDEPRLSITIEEPVEMPEEGDEYAEIKITIFDGLGDNHFCGEACLASWAYSRHLGKLP